MGLAYQSGRTIRGGIVALARSDCLESHVQPRHWGSGSGTHTRKAPATREAPQHDQVRDDRTNRTPVRDKLGALGSRRGL